MGTPEFAVPVLQTLIDNTNVVMVVTQPDKEVGRNKVLTPTPVKRLALKNNIEVFQPLRIREENQKVLEMLLIKDDGTVNAPIKEIAELVKERNEARSNKNWAESDRIRDILIEKGYTVKDSKEGTIVEKQ